MGTLSTQRNTDLHKFGVPQGEILFHGQRTVIPIPHDVLSLTLSARDRDQQTRLIAQAWRLGHP